MIPASLRTDRAVAGQHLGASPPLTPRSAILHKGRYVIRIPRINRASPVPWKPLLTEQWHTTGVPLSGGIRIIHVGPGGPRETRPMSRASHGSRPEFGDDSVGRPRGPIPAMACTFRIETEAGRQQRGRCSSVRSTEPNGFVVSLAPFSEFEERWLPSS